MEPEGSLPHSKELTPSPYPEEKNITFLEFNNKNVVARKQIICVCVCVCVPGSSVGIANGYGLNGSGSNPGGDENFRPSRPALGPTQPPVQWVPRLSRGTVRPGRAADHSPPSSAAVMEE